MAASLFKKVSLIVLTALLGGAIGFGASYSQPQLWQSQVRIEPPKVMELGNYFSLYNTYQFLSGNVSQQSNEEAAIQYAYAEFKRNLGSQDRLRAFLTEHETVKVIAQAEQKNLAQVVEQLATQFQLQDDFLTFSLAKAEQAQQVLTDFINDSNNRTRQTLNDDLIVKWKNLFSMIKNAAENNLGATQQGGQIVSQDWRGKLALMRSVAPLDNTLVAYRFLQSPTLALEPISPNHLWWLEIGAGVGFFIGLLFASFGIRRAANPNNG